MKDKQEIKIGVKDLLEVLYLPKDLDSTFAASVRGQDGIFGHQIIKTMRPEGYQTEVPVEFAYENDEFRLLVRGRSDGILINHSGIIVEEIKTTYIPLNTLNPLHYPIHEAQLKLYTYFLMMKYPEAEVTGRLTYLNLENLSERTFTLQLTLKEGEIFFRSLAEGYLQMEASCITWRCIRNLSIINLPFPFAEPRPGQQQLMDTVTQALEQERDLLIEAATGTGKTVAVLFPALKRLSESNRFNQIFYLTAKNAGKEILKKTLSHLINQGLRLRTVFVEAKERVCLAPGNRCHPRECPYAADYYSKAQQVIPNLLAQEFIKTEAIREIAEAHIICPFELSLDLSLFVDLIVCDYNYVFDPGVYLRRFFAKNNRKDFLFLIDEAHNLVTRGREMYSASLSEIFVSRFLSTSLKVLPKIAMACSGVDTFFQSWQQELAEGPNSGMLIKKIPEFFIPALEKLITLLELELKENSQPNIRERVLNFYFEMNAFLRITNLINEDYAIYIKPDPEKADGLTLQLFCLNPGSFLKKRIGHGRSAVFFSATLTPFEYYQDLLGGKPDALSFRLTSPFPQETRLYFHVPGIDTRYRLRGQSSPELAKVIASLVTSFTGNYLIFFPSYSYLQSVIPLVKILLANEANLYIQFPSMHETQRLEFLRKVTQSQKGRSNVGFAVLGGSFGEGIDLPGEQLIGVMVVGPGLPMVNEEQELIREYFDTRNGHGFLYAYLIPGLTRVIQAAGRVFRTPEDKGVVLLVDDRFLNEQYQELLPPDWFAPGRLFSNEQYEQVLEEFWESY